MTEPAAPHPGTTTTRAAPVPQRHRAASTIRRHETPARTQRPAVLDRFRMAVAPLRQMMRRTFRRK
jgi:hypothetical protein